MKVTILLKHHIGKPFKESEEHSFRELLTRNIDMLSHDPVKDGIFMLALLLLIILCLIVLC